MGIPVIVKISDKIKRRTRDKDFSIEPPFFRNRGVPTILKCSHEGLLRLVDHHGRHGHPLRLFGDRLLRPRCYPGSLAGPIRLVQGGHFHGHLHVFCHRRRHGDGHRKTYRSIRAQTDTDLRVSNHRNRFHSSEPGDPTLAVLRGLHPHGRGLEWNLPGPHQYPDSQLVLPQAGVRHGIDHDRVEPGWNDHGPFFRLPNIPLRTPDGLADPRGHILAVRHTDCGLHHQTTSFGCGTIPGRWRRRDHFPNRPQVIE